MTHLDDGTILAVRDGEAHEPSAHIHLQACLPCRERLAEARSRAGVIADVLSDLPGRSDDAFAKAQVRRRLDEARRRETRLLPRSFRRAAAILLVSAGAAYALPRTPLPGWLGLGEEPVTTVAPVQPAGVEEADADALPQEAVLVPVGARLEVYIEDVPPGRDVELLWLDGRAAWITAGPGATYAVGDGTATVRAPNGLVRLGVPRSAPLVVLRVNGRMVFEGTGEGSTVGRILFPAPGA